MLNQVGRVMERTEEDKDGMGRVIRRKSRGKESKATRHIEAKRIYELGLTRDDGESELV
jgi:hypothetical protein